MIRYLSLFTGIGAFEKALKNIGVEYKLVGFSEIDKYAIKSYCAVHGVDESLNLGDISKIDLDGLPKDIDLITHGSPCLTNDSLILTNKGYIPLEEVNVGDKVLTKSNTWQKVNKKFNNGIHKTIYLQAMGFENIHCTLEHKFYVREMYKKWNNEVRCYERVFKEPIFIEAQKLNKNHYLGVPIIQEEIPFYTDDLEFWYLIGLYLGDGWLKLGKGYDIVFGLNKSKIEKLNKYVDKSNYNWTVRSERTIERLRFANKSMYEFIKTYIGTGSFEKHIPYEILCLPKEQLKMVYQGYLDSDGCNIKDTDTFQFTSVNRNLIYSISLIINKLFNRPTCIYFNEVEPTKNIENRIVNQHNWYMLRFSMTRKKQDHAFYENNYIWYPFTKIEEGENESVYNMEIETDHSYIVQGCISKNCQDFSIAGKLAGGDKGSGTRSSLMWCTVDIVEKTRPKYVLWENVKNLLSKKNRHNFDGYLQIMDEMGYNSYYKVLNAKNFGIPQNRERVFTVSIRKDIDTGYEFPEGFELKKKLKDVLEEVVDEKYYLSDKLLAGLIASTERNKEKGNGFAFETTDGEGIAKTVTTRVGACRTGDNYIKSAYTRDFGSKGKVQETDDVCSTLQAAMGNGGGNVPIIKVVGELDIKGHDCIKRVYSGEGLAPTLTDMQGGNRQPKVMLNEPVIAASRGRNPDNPGDRTPGIPTEQRLEINKQGLSNTITTVQKDNYVVEPVKAKTKIRIRKLSPRECWRLMGFDDEDFEKAAGVPTSNTQLYKQARKLNSCKCIRSRVQKFI